MKMKMIPAVDPMIAKYIVDPNFVKVRNNDAHIGERICRIAVRIALSNPIGYSRYGPVTSQPMPASTSAANANPPMMRTTGLSRNQSFSDPISPKYSGHPITGAKGKSFIVLSHYSDTIGAKNLTCISIDSLTGLTGVSL